MIVKSEYRALVGAMMMLAAITGGGCQPQTPVPTTAPAIGGIDPCAERLHDICQELLLYHAAHLELPSTLAALGKSAAELKCPISGEAYVYDRTGLAVPPWTGRLIVYDAKCCHDGTRWGILAEPSEPQQAVVLRVVRIPQKPK